MVRTRSFGVKAGGKSSKKNASSSAPASSAGSSSASKKGDHGNAVQVQPTPTWQREITGFLGNPPKKMRLDDDDRSNSPDEGHVQEDKPTGVETADSKAGDDSVNGNVKVSAGDKNSSGKEENEEDKPGPAAKGAVKNTNGCQTLDEDSPVVVEDVDAKDTLKKVEKQRSVSPVVAEGEKNAE